MSVNVSDPHSLASAGWLEAAGPDGWPRISLSISPRQPPHSQLSGGPSPPWSGHMGGLKIWLVLCLGYLVTTQHQRNNEANKKKTFETNFEKLGKFRKAAIGETNLKSKPKEW